MKNVINLKRGDSLAFEIELVDSENLPLSEIQSIRSQIRTMRNVLVDEFKIEDLEGGVFRFSVEDTTKYPIADLMFDIEINRNGIVTSSDTTILRITRDVTYDG